MEIKVKKLKSANKISLKGELTIYQAEQAANNLLSDSELYSQPVKLDLNAITEIDTAGVQILLMMKKVAAKKGFSISATNDTVSSVFNLLSLNAMLSVDK